MRRPTVCRAMSNSTREILAQLLAFDTTSRESNLALIDWIADFLAARGVASQRLRPSGAIWAGRGHAFRSY